MLTRFKTDRRWWLWISVVLFVLPWFLPIWNVKEEMMRPAAVWGMLFEQPTNLGEAIGAIVAFALMFGIPAVAIGWVLHCVVVMIRDAKKQRANNGG